MSDPWNDPDTKRWVAHIRHQVEPKIRGSVLTIVVDPGGGVDVKIAVELGLSILLNKPIIAIVPPGRVPSPGLVRVAHEVIEGTYDDPETRRELMDALARWAVEP